MIARQDPPSADPPARSVTRNVASLAIGNAGGVAITFLALPVLSRIYVPEHFGVLATYLALSVLLGTLATLRYEFAVPLPTEHGEAATLLRAGRRIVLVSGAITLLATGALAAATWANWLPLDHSTLFMTLALTVPLAGEAAMLNYWFTRTERFQLQGAARIVQASVTALVQILLGLTTEPGPAGLVVGVLVGQLACTALLIICDDSARHRTPGQGPSMRELLHRHRSMPLLNGPKALVDAARINGMNLIIGARSLESLGQFSMAMRLVQAPLGVLGTAIAQVSYQRMATAPPGQLGQVVTGIIRRCLVLGFLPFLSIFLIAPTLVPLALGQQWGDAGAYAQALTPWLYLNLATSPLSMVFLVADRQGVLLAFTIVYTLAPLALLAVLSSDLDMAVRAVSAAMTALLVILILLAVKVARGHDVRNA